MEFDEKLLDGPPWEVAEPSVGPTARGQPPLPIQQPRGSTTHEAHAADWLTLADTVSEIQKSRGGSLYDARMEMFGELFTGVRKARGFRNGRVHDIDRKWFI